MTSAEFKSALRLLLCSLLLLILTRIPGSRLPEVGALSLRLQALAARKIRSLRCEMRIPERGEAGALSLRLGTLDTRDVRSLRASESTGRANSTSLSDELLKSLDSDVSEKLLFELKLSRSDSLLYNWLPLALDMPIQQTILNPHVIAYELEAKDTHAPSICPISVSYTHLTLPTTPYV